MTAWPGSGRARWPRQCGFTLAELCVVMAVAGVLAAVSWPSLREPLLRGKRADAVAALTRIQFAQESHRAAHGLYATQLDALAGAAARHSREGFYELALLGEGANRYEARATARADTPVAADSACRVLVLRVREGLADYGPTPRCWNR